jgi:hypothetical protein
VFLFGSSGAGVQAVSEEHDDEDEDKEDDGRDTSEGEAGVDATVSRRGISSRDDGADCACNHWESQQLEDLGVFIQAWVCGSPGTNPARRLKMVLIGDPYHRTIKALEAAMRGRKPNWERIRPQTATSTLVDEPFSVTTNKLSPTIFTAQLELSFKGVG